MSNGQEDMATRINNWLIAEALTAYGIVRGATFLLAKKCERNVQLALGNARVLFKWVIEHLQQSPQDIDRAPEVVPSYVVNLACLSLPTLQKVNR